MPPVVYAITCRDLACEVLLTKFPSSAPVANWIVYRHLNKTAPSNTILLCLALSLKVLVLIFQLMDSVVDMSVGFVVRFCNLPGVLNISLDGIGK